MHVERDDRPAPPRLTPAARMLIVVSPYHRAIAAHLLAGAGAVLEAAGARVETIEAPGALEIAAAIRLAATGGASGGGFEGYVALGCVIRGETTHYETVCAESARGLTLLGVGHGLCIGNGVLTVETEAQALERARPDAQDKGGDAARAALALVALARRFGVRPAIGSGADADAILLA